MKKLITSLLVLLVISSTVMFAQSARVQIIHNSPDPLFSTVDIDINSGLLTLDNVDFRTATAFVTVPSGTPITVEIKDSTSTTTYATANFDSLASGETYAIIASGVGVPGSFTANPDGISTQFQLLAVAGDLAETGQNGMGMVDLTVVHGSPDAPSVDVVARGVGTLLDNVPYLTAGGISVPAGSYTIDVADSTGNTVVASYTADVSALGGGAAIVFASGFLNAGQGEAFGLWVALADGTTFALPAAAAPPTARVQIIHNAADPAADTVDIEINGNLLVLDDVAFRTATPFVTVPAGAPIEVVVKTKDGSATIETFNFDSLATGETYVIIANGVATPGSFTANPDGEDIAFDLYVYGMGQESSTNMGKTDLLFFHGATDAPTVDIIANGSVVLTDDITYGSFDGYVEVDPANYTVAITLADGTTEVVAYLAPLTTAANGAAVAFASGFLDASQGEAFGVYVALPDGSVIALPVATGIDEVAFNADLSVYPNPANSQVQVNFTLPENEQVAYRLVNTLGQTVSSTNLGVVNAGTSNININVTDLNAGLYVLQMTIGNNTNVNRTIIVE